MGVQSSVVVDIEAGQVGWGCCGRSPSTTANAVSGYIGSRSPARGESASSSDSSVGGENVGSYSESSSELPSKSSTSEGPG